MSKVYHIDDVVEAVTKVISSYTYLSTRNVVERRFTDHFVNKVTEDVIEVLEEME